jgi:hypothetical protein
MNVEQMRFRSKNRRLPRVDVMITIFGDFCQFSAIFATFRRKYWRFTYLKPNNMIRFLQKLAEYLTEIAIFAIVCAKFFTKI